MLSSGRNSRRNWLRIVIMTSAFLAIALGIMGQACANEWIIFDGFVYDTDGVTPVKAMVIAYYPAYPSGIVTGTFMDGYWPYGYYILNGTRSGGIATIYAYTYSDDHSYMNRKSQEVVVDLDGIASGSHVTRNLTLQALPHVPTPTATPTPVPVKPCITYTGHVYCDGVPVKDAGVFCTYGGDTTGAATNETGCYQFTTPNRGGLATIKASYFGTAAVDYPVVPEYGSIVSHNFYINTSPQDNPVPAQTIKNETAAATPVPGNIVATVTPSPKPTLSVTPRMTPGNIDLSGLLKTAAIVAGGVIVVLLVLYCLAILIVTKL